MRYTAVIMIPRIVLFESEGSSEHRTNQAWALCNQFDSVIMPETTFAPRLLGVIPDEEETKSPMVFDPPPQAA